MKKYAHYYPNSPTALCGYLRPKKAEKRKKQKCPVCTKMVKYLFKVEV